MSSLTAAELAPSAIAADREKLAAARARVAELTRQLSELQDTLAQARAAETELAHSVQWRELMAAVNADDDVYAVTERLTSTFAAFRASLVEPEEYVQSQKDDIQRGEAAVPYSDTDDYADFSGVEAVVEDILVSVKETLSMNAADPVVRSSNRSSPTGSFAHGSKVGPGAAGSSEANALRAATRRQAFLQMVVLTVLMGKVEEHCSFGSIPDPASAPHSDADELREGVASTWQWMFYEQPGVLSKQEREEWMGIVGTFLGDTYTAAP